MNKFPLAFTNKHWADIKYYVILSETNGFYAKKDKSILLAPDKFVAFHPVDTSKMWDSVPYSEVTDFLGTWPRVFEFTGEACRTYNQFILFRSPNDYTAKTFDGRTIENPALDSDLFNVLKKSSVWREIHPSQYPQTEGNKMSFKIGDRVKVKWYKSYGTGKTDRVGTITHTTDNSDDFCIRLDDEQVGVVFAADWLELLPKPIKVGDYEVNTVTKQGFKVGCTEVSWETYKKIGELQPK